MIAESNGAHQRGEQAAATVPDVRAHLRGHIYFAAPLTTYHTARYERLLARVRRLFPRATIVDARALFAGHPDWRRQWRAVLGRCVGLVFITDEAGCIGRGVWRERADARAAGLPTWYLDDAGELHTAERVDFSLPDRHDWRQYARVTVRDGAGEEGAA